ncbi:MAG TPA: tetratricopeptide repeat protein [Verrucomicrobiae bacterium]|nr:tetratricopeptide repeat protein [Verrucomicrobiae bacterium]
MTRKISQQWTARLICLSLAAAVLAVFWGAMRCDFVNYDDPTYVTSNADVQHGLTKAGAAWAFETGAASNWHPLTWLSHMADVQFYGMRPAGHHLTSVIIHAANAVLLFLILNAMTGAIWRSAVVAALWALHPLRVESVVWISERKDVLSTLFWLLAVWSYVKFQSSRLKFYYVAAVVCFACGLMAKPMVVTLPFVLLLLDYWPLKRRMTWGLVTEKIPFFVLAAVSGVVTFAVQRRGGAVSPLSGLPILARVGNSVISYVRYLAKIFWPARLSVLYPHPGYWPIRQVAGAAALLVAITAIVIWRRRAQPYAIVGWFWFLGILAPTIGLVQVGIQSMADRYSYVPMAGILILVVWTASEVVRARWILGAAAGLAIAACAVLTPVQVGYWHDSDTLFQHAVAVTKDNYLAYNNLGFFLSNRGETEKAMLYYKSSLQINPNYDEAHNNLGYALAQLGRFAEATNEYIKALSLNPNLTEAHNNLGNALGSLGLRDAAIHEYQAALQENPRHADAHNNYGIALAMHGQLKEAIEQFRLAVLYKEDYASAHSDLGNALAMQGDYPGAIAEYETCLRLNPKDPQGHNNLANVFAQEGKLDEAAEQYRTALELKTENPEAHFNFGLCLARQGKQREAAEQFRIALRQRPDYPAAQQEVDTLIKAGL